MSSRCLEKRNKLLVLCQRSNWEQTYCRQEAQTFSHKLILYQFSLLATCFGSRKSHHQAI